MPEESPSPGTCQRCGGPIPPRQEREDGKKLQGRARRFCSAECRTSFHNATRASSSSTSSSSVDRTDEGWPIDRLVRLAGDTLATARQARDGFLAMQPDAVAAQLAEARLQASTAQARVVQLDNDNAAAWEAAEDAEDEAIRLRSQVADLSAQASELRGQMEALEPQLAERNEQLAQANATTAAQA
ncbi:hypothetical protein ACFFG9_30035, partial [Kutzneria buriramensis]